MADAASSLRDQGRQALQAGNLDGAIDLLARAVMADDADLAAKMLLGIAYSLKGLHPQAKRALQTAVEREPGNADFRFNLGMVLEKAGDAPGAAQAFRDTLQINPQHPQARAKLQAMGPHAGYAPAAPPPAPPAPPTEMPYAPPASPSRTAAPSPSGTAGGMAPPPGPPGMAAPPLGGLPPSAPSPMGAHPPFGAPLAGSPLGAPLPVAPPLGAPPSGLPPESPTGGMQLPGTIPGLGGGLAPPPGMVQCPRCGQFSRPGMLCEFCSAPLPPPAPRPAAAAGAAPAAFGSTGPVAGYAPPPPADNFDIREGFAQWGQLLLGPRAFFAGQAGRDGFKEPGAFAMAWCLAHYGVSFVLNLIHRTVGSNIGDVTCGWICTWLMTMGILFVWAGLLHGLARLFGGQGSFSSTFRTAAYGAGPLLLCSTIGLIAIKLLMPAPETLRNNARLPRTPVLAAASPALPSRDFLPLSLAQFGPPAGSPFGTPPGAPTFGTPPGGSPFGTQPGLPAGGLAQSRIQQQKAKIQRLQSILQQLTGALIPAAFIIGFGYLWSLVLLVIGLGETHSLGTGGAVGAVLIAAAIMAAIIGGIGLAVGSLVAAAIQAVMSGGVSPPGGRGM